MNAIGKRVMILGAVLLLAGCGRTVYLEQDAQPGYVEPPPAAPLGMEQQHQGQMQVPIGRDPERIDPNSAEGQALLASGPGHGGGKPMPGLDGDTVGAFTRAYAAQRRPRIALYLNRELSDRVQEWGGGGGDLQVITRSKVGQDHHGPNREDEVITSGRVHPGQGYDDDGSRPAPVEDWGWAFENGLIGHLLGANVQLVDRATIIRLTGAETTPNAGGQFGGGTARTIEMDALKGKADLFIEILVKRAANPMGYEFKAVAKEVRSGLIKAHVTSLGWDWEHWTPSGPKQLTFKNGDYAGYIAKLPTPHQVAEWLTADLMKSLTRQWAQ
ncbi:MAG: hypothetical protein HQL82_17125 [Magnetococcales bacterium]|nr:hypothetical protein [Magnetococcales bacterium]